MSTEQHKYLILWKKYRPIIVSKMKSLNDNESDTYRLSEHEFLSIGNRESAGYTFNIQIRNGRIDNNLSGSAVARDLKLVLFESETVFSLIRKKNYTIRMDQKFVLHIECDGDWKQEVKI